MHSANELKSTRLQALQAQGISERAAALQAVQVHNRQVMEARARRMDPARLSAMLANMQRAAEAGKKSLTVLTYPSDVCEDRGRAINSTGSDWAATLRGEAADLYTYYDREMRPQGYALTAAVQSFPNGIPGDIAMTIAWG